MTKPQKPTPGRHQKAPEARKPEAPFASSPGGPRRAQPPQDRKRNGPPGAPGQSSSRKPPEAQNPAGAQISRRAADRLRSGHAWVYASDIESINVDENRAPRLVPVADNRGILLGTALYSASSQIALRMISREAVDEGEWLRILKTRLRAAIERRKPLLDENTNACRLVFSEADELPGLVADKYGDLIILQLLARGLDSADVRAACVSVLREELAPAAIVERPDPRMRELEGLSAPGTAPLWARNGDRDATSTRFRLNGLEFLFDANAGQKTGAFLDQRANYSAAMEWATRLGTTERALDVCCYQGGFALHLARVCRRVTGIDASRPSLEVAEQNLAANRDRLSAEVDWVEGDAFAILRDWSTTGEQFDAIVLDPPAFAKTKRAVEGALARIQGIEPARDQDDTARGTAGELFVLASRGLGRPGGGRGVRGGGCAAAGFGCWNGEAPHRIIRWC